MNKEVTLIDYGSGNLLSVTRALEHCAAKVLIAHDPTQISQASHLILPGVGAFADGMEGLRRNGLIEAIRQHAISGRPLLGICLGMQMLATTSTEFGVHEGLGLIPGTVDAIPPAVDSGPGPLKIPHIGWAELERPDGRDWHGTVLQATTPATCVYLVHSYHYHPLDSASVLATYSYGGHHITAAVRQGNVTGCQFHPEKSGQAGLEILRAFLDMHPMTSAPETSGAS